MHNIKQIREKRDYFEKKLKDRNISLNLNELLNLDQKNRELIQKKEKFEQEKKVISKTKDKSQFDKSKKISMEIEKLEKSQNKISGEINKIIEILPNIALDDVPIGKDENANKEIGKFGKINKFNFKPKSHDELGKQLNLMDFDTASKTSGSRFVFLKGKLAELERAISNFM